MIDPTILDKLVEEAIEQEGAFLIDLEVKQGDHISLLVDHLDGLTLERITQMSRHIRNGLDEQEYDYQLEVSSPGVGQPLKIPQQFVKNVGRTVGVKTLEGEELEATLVNFEADTLHLEYKVREPKPVGKGKVTVTKTRTFVLNELDTVKVLVKF
jgi:ribosome maturation factor RimP